MDLRTGQWGPMTKNDENLTVVKDADLAAIYLKEILSQIFTYRYGQRVDANGFRQDLDYLSKKVPCLKSYLGMENKCGQSDPQSTAIISVSDVPASSSERLWAWVPELNYGKGGAIEFFTHETFSGKWLGAIPMPLGWTSHFKLFLAPKDLDPNRDGLNRVRWEYEGINNDRDVFASSLAVDVILGNYRWGVRY